MNKQNTDYLLEKYENLYARHKLPMTETCMCWLFEFGDGWFNIVDELSQQLSSISPNIQADQVKQKFGGLRFYLYYNGDVTEEERTLADKYISEAEGKSLHTCEYCGKFGRDSGGRYIIILCDECKKLK